MGFFHKKDKDVLASNQETLKNSLQAAQIFAATVTEGEVGEKLKKLADVLTYSSASRDAQVVAFDKKISDKLGDLKIALNKAKSNERYDVVMELADEIMALLNERNVRIG